MPVIADFSIARFEDGVLTVSMNPPVPIGGWSIQFNVSKNFGGGSGLIQKYVSSGLNNQSGINVTNSGIGVFSVTINSADTSGLNYGNYAYTVNRSDSGNATLLAEGYFTVKPGVG